MTVIVVTLALSLSLSAGTPFDRQAPAPITAADAFRALDMLLGEKRFAAPLFGPIAFTALKAENCFGVVFANGTRVIGESSRGYGLLYRREGQPPQLAIGMVALTGATVIGSTTVPAGEYIVFAAPDALSFMNDARDKGGTPAKISVPLSVRIPEARLLHGAQDTPRFSIVIDKETVVLAVAGNQLAARPR